MKTTQLSVNFMLDNYGNKIGSIYCTRCHEIMVSIKGYEKGNRYVGQGGNPTYEKMQCPNCKRTVIMHIEETSTQKINNSVKSGNENKLFVVNFNNIKTRMYWKKNFMLIYCPICNTRKRQQIDIVKEPTYQYFHFYCQKCDKTFKIVYDKAVSTYP